MKRLLPLTIIFILSACATTTRMAPIMQDSLGREMTFRSFPIDWGFDCEFPPQFKKTVREGFQFWDDLTPLALFHEIDVCQRLIEADQAIVVTAVNKYLQRDDKIVFGTYSPSRLDGEVRGGLISLYNDFTKWCDQGTRVTVVRHEVGHALGFDHYKYSDCLMAPYVHEEDLDPKYHYPKNLCREEMNTFRKHYVPTGK
jgi:hypothetical protein